MHLVIVSSRGDRGCVLTLVKREKPCNLCYSCQSLYDQDAFSTALLPARPHCLLSMTWGGRGGRRVEGAVGCHGSIQQVNVEDTLKRIKRGALSTRVLGTLTAEGSSVCSYFYCQ